VNRFEALAQPGIQRLRAYDPGHDLAALRRRVGASLVELGSNENSHGPSARVREAILGELAGLFRYPDPLGGGLKRALSDLHGIEPAQFLLGNGSHELLMQFGQVFAGPGTEVVASRYGFAVYALAAQAAGASLRLAEAHPRDHAMPRGHDPEALAAAVTPGTRLMFFANPNNPTGTWFGSDALERLLDAVPRDVLIVVDEAYIEYADAPGLRSALALLPRFPNLVVTRTFSKAYGLAALRVGYAVAHPDLIAVMERVRESFNVNSLALAAAVVALDDEAHLDRVRTRNREERAFLRVGLERRGLFVHPSQTNFLLVETGPDTARIEAGLVAAGVILRPMGGYGLGECLRITVGTRDENLRLLVALDGVVA
jgi:histidinol-phosphate aminotransferase